MAHSSRLVHSPFEFHPETSELVPANEQACAQITGVPLFIENEVSVIVDLRGAGQVKVLRLGVASRVRADRIAFQVAVLTAEPALAFGENPHPSVAIAPPEQVTPRTRRWVGTNNPSSPSSVSSERAGH